MTNRLYNVVIYKLEQPGNKFILATTDTLGEVRRIMRMIAGGKGWIMNRRPDVHTCGDIILAYEEVR